MKLIILALMCLVAFAAAAQSELELKKMFMQFKAKHGKSYSSNSLEHQARFEIFKKNLEMAKKAQKNDKGSATFGVTKFMDLSPEEFRQKYLMPKMSAEQMAAKNGLKRAAASKVGDLPSSYDWRQKGAVSPVKDQGQCGSCWSFSTTGSLESQRVVKYGVPMATLSEQQLVDCDRKEDQGCNGGLMINAFTYINSVGGLESEKDYPYLAIDSSCKFDANKIVNKTMVTSSNLLPKDAESIKKNLVEQGAISVAINAEWLQTYGGGISAPWMCDITALDHGVLIVGYGTGKTWLGKTIDYWIVKNSWSAGWGEDGYFKQAMSKTGKDASSCGIQTYAVNLVLP